MNFVKNYFKRFFRNKKIMGLTGIIILISGCLFVDFIVNQFFDENILIEDNENAIPIEGEDIDNAQTSQNSDGNTEDSSSKSDDLGDLNGTKAETENGLNTDTANENGDFETSNETSDIYIYVTGEVNHQGVVVLKEGSRISDAIDAAGGITGAANISKINLVFVLEDGMKVNIPNDNDLKNNPDFKYITMGSGDGDINTSINGASSGVGSNDSGSSNNGGSSGSSSNSKNTYPTKIQVVNINTATQTELETLPGIGPSLSLKIIHYREENGRFTSIEDIKNVSGIGDSKFNNIKDYITV